MDGDEDERKNLTVIGEGTYAAQYRIHGGPIGLFLATARLWRGGDG